MDGAKSDTRVSFGVLGPLEVHHDGRRLDVGGRRLRALLTLLLLNPGRTVPFGTLVEGVWEAGPPNGVGNALQALVSRLRGTLGRGLVAAEPSGYRLVISPDQVDAHRFARLADDGRTALARGDADEAARLLREALALWRGPALADLGSFDAAVAEITRLDGLRLAAVEDRIDADLLLGRYAEVVGELGPLIAAHPLSERLRGQLMRALYGSGRQVEALAAYQAARADFADLLGADPSPVLADLHLSLLRGTSPHAGDGGVSGAAVVGGPERKKGNLRARFTSFVGREKDVERAGTLLASQRLVTMLGPGGAGKTRLAVESGEALADRMPDGVWLAELAPIRDPEGVPQAVLAALGMRDTRRVTARTPGSGGAGTPDVPPTDAIDLTARLVEGLASRQQLIILDNCEHLLDGVARLVDRILAECPDVRILATSREPLGLTGELLWPVQPLDQEHAQDLFADRAATVRPGYVVDGDAQAVARICRELDGMPLAIELAAARLRSLSAGQIADRLDDRFRLLTGGSRTALPRHQTLRAVVEWSWDLLDDRERVLTRRLAAFAGGATLEAVETICSDDPPYREPAGSPEMPGAMSAGPPGEGGGAGPAEEGGRTGSAGEGGRPPVRLEGGLPKEDVLDVLARLVDKSLVVCENERYRMLETIRAYAAERLAESREERPVRLAHARFFTALAETAEPELRRADQVEWLEVLSGQHDNMTAALRWAIASREQDIAARLAGALGWYWFLAGRRAEGAQRAAEVVALIGDDEPERAAVALAVCGILLAGGTNQWREARVMLQKAVRLAREFVPRPWPSIVSLAEPVLALFLDSVTDPDHFAVELFDHPDLWVVASAHLLRAHFYFSAGRLAEGEADVGAAIGHFRSVGDRWGVGTAMAALSELSTLRGDNALTISIIHEALALVDQIGTTEDTPYMRTRLAMAMSASGDRAGADAVLTQALEICRAAGDRLGESGVLSVLGDFAREERKFSAARGHYDEAIRLASDPMVPPGLFRGLLISSVGMLAEQEGDLRAAREAHTQALSLAWDTNDGAAFGLMLIALAGLTVREGDAVKAAELLGAAAHIRGIDDVVGFDHVRITDATVAALGPEQYARSFEHGRSLPRHELLPLALLAEDTPPAPT
ncbi:ATP-binding protein [Sphaerisporangium corydalis]|uniref:ATP-binding protein n=1 Tax=Sphaerisporangium corydalis TaxID=1441875 RepID=A0ABV9EBG2_9ACTN|nr:BTAD domain-containing putative transcriptional regulator [Sphaerisporangium corydalis]